MDQIERDVEPQGLSRRTVVTAAAWAAPVVALASAAPMAAASTTPRATSIGGRTDSPQLGDVGQIWVYGLDPNGDDAVIPTGQTFTLTSAALDFSPSPAGIVESVTGGTLTSAGAGAWTITPSVGSLKVIIKFRPTTTGAYVVTNNGPVTGGPTWSGTIV